MLRLVVLVVGLSLCAACTQLLTSVTPGSGRPGVAAGQRAPARPDVPYVATPPAVVAKMLELAQVTKDDVVYDLGSGDGRIVIMAARASAPAAWAWRSIHTWCGKHTRTPNGVGVADRVHFLLQDLFPRRLSEN